MSSGAAAKRSQASPSAAREKSRRKSADRLPKTALRFAASKGSAKENLKKIMAEHEKSVEAERVARMRAAAIERGESDDEGEEGGEGGDGPMDGAAAEGAAGEEAGAS